MTLLGAARGLLPVRRTLRIGVIGLARAGKTALLTSIAANLLAGPAALPALAARLDGRRLRVGVAPAGADSQPRFDYAAHLAALAADPPRWPARTDAVSLLALDLEISRSGIVAMLPNQTLRLEFLDYPGEWLLDMAMLGQDFAAWSAATLRRLEGTPLARDFLGFVRGLPAGAAADETLARTGAGLYRDLLRGLRDEDGRSLLQPGRFLMPAPGPPPPWMAFFPHAGSGGLAGLLASRYDAYLRQVGRELAAPSFGRIDRLVVLADLLGALHAGEAAFADAALALATVTRALRWRGRPAFLPAWLAGLLPLGGISRVAFAASKSDHVAERQRGNLARLMGALTPLPGQGRNFALAAVRCTEDFVWSLEGRPVSAVRGRVEGQGLLGVYPGEVPDQPPGPEFWAHPFLAIPQLQPMQLPLGGRAGVPHINLDALLAFLLEDVI